MSKIRKRTAIKKCEKMWRTLAETGSDNKWEVTHELKHRPYMECWACEFAKQDGHGGITDIPLERTGKCGLSCILSDVWGIKRLSEKGICVCEYANTPYGKWCRAKTTKTRKKYAKIIADGCVKLLKESK